ncbi:MAG: sulfotransferase family 2 domain-containing protein, partial [Oscillatoria sp. PMC 1068.18]|nr:sulfotransferase family 2 domain-containing protein [Oscillatoria sp. PMC 1068.18]
MSKANLNLTQAKLSVVFLHIPKTAGQTLHEIIEKQYSEKQIYTIGSKTQQRIEQLKVLPETERSKIKVIKGHLLFGIHDFLPQPCTYITMLRHPVERAISTYYFVLRSKIHPLHEQVTSQQMTLEDFINSGISTDLDNGQTRRLAGVSTGGLSSQQKVPLGQCSENLLEIAKANLNSQFSVCGITEKFDESLLLMSKKLGWKNIYYRKKNVTKNRLKRKDINAKIVKQIEA